MENKKVIDNTLIRFVKDFAELNPRPIPQQLEWLGMALGFEPEDMKVFVVSAQKKIEALTRDEQALNDVIPQEEKTPEQVLMVDGEKGTIDPGLQQELAEDGKRVTVPVVEEEEDAIKDPTKEGDLDKQASSNDGTPVVPNSNPNPNSNLNPNSSANSAPTASPAN